MCDYRQKRLKMCVYLLTVTHFRAMSYLPYGIVQCWLPFHRWLCSSSTPRETDQYKYSCFTNISLKVCLFTFFDSGGFNGVGGPPIVWMHLWTGENCAQNAPFLHKVIKIPFQPLSIPKFWICHCFGSDLSLWLCSLTVTCRTCNPEVTQRRRFDSAPGHCRLMTLGKLFTHMCLCHQAV